MRLSWQQSYIQWKQWNLVSCREFEVLVPNEFLEPNIILEEIFKDVKVRFNHKMTHSK